jgi:hypothetical protein
MARRQAIIRGTSGRDKGKAYLITEMPASHAERWAMRAIMAMASSGAEMPDGMEGAGLAGIAAMVAGADPETPALAMLARGALVLFSRVPFDVADQLMVDMFSCVQMIPDPARTDVVRYMVEDDIEEVATRLKLRAELLKLHLGFSSAAA